MTGLPVQTATNYYMIPSRAYSKTYSLKSLIVDTIEKEPSIKDIVQQILATVEKDPSPQLSNDYSIDNSRCSNLSKLVFQIIAQEYPEKSLYPQLVESITLHQIFENDFNACIEKIVSYLKKVQNLEHLAFSALFSHSFPFNQVLEKVLKIEIGNPWLEERTEDERIKIVQAAIVICIPQ